MQRSWLIAFLVLVAMLIAAPVTSLAGSDPPIVVNNASNATATVVTSDHSPPVLVTQSIMVAENAYSTCADQFALSPTDASTYKPADNANLDETCAWNSNHSDALMAMITRASTNKRNDMQMVLSTARPNENTADVYTWNSFAANANAPNDHSLVTAQTTMETWMMTVATASPPRANTEGAPQYSLVDVAAPTSRA